MYAAKGPAEKPAEGGLAGRAPSRATRMTAAAQTPAEVRDAAALGREPGVSEATATAVRE